MSARSPRGHGLRGHSLRGLSVAIAGAGVFGLAVGVALARAGARVILIDPSPAADNASRVAAGMLAPAFEALLDPPMAGRFGLLKAARNLWPDFLSEEVGGPATLRRSRAAWVDRPGAAPMRGAYTAALAAMGARTLPYDGPFGSGSGVATTDDWLIDPGAALARLATELAGLGGLQMAGRGASFDSGLLRMANGDSLRTDRLVIATGAEPSRLAPELVALAPIKGQLLHFVYAVAGQGGPVIRCAGGYAAPGAGGLKVGATMEPGLTDRRPTAAAVEELRALAVALFPDLTDAPFQPLAGVRASSPDGLPLVGPSAAPGVMLAVGARRNGWLLAPLVAAITAAYLAGDDPGPYARAFDPSRFGPG